MKASGPFFHSMPSGTMIPAKRMKTERTYMVK